MIVNDPHEARIRVREQKFNNYTEEVQTIQRVDVEVYQRVADFEAGVVGTARAYADRGDALAEESVDFIVDFRTRFAEAAASGDVNRDLLREFTALRNRAERLADSLDVAERGAAWHVGRLSDVYGAWRSILAKYPSLRPGIDI